MTRLRRVRRALTDPPTLAALTVLALLLTVVAPIGFDTADAEGELLLVADLRGHALVLVDPAAPEAASRLPLPGGPHEMLTLPDGRVAVSLEQAGLLALVDVPRRQVQTIDLGGLPHGLALDGGTLYVTDRASDVVRRLDLPLWREDDPLPAGHWPHSVAVLPDGRLAAAQAGDSTLTVGTRTLEVSAVPETVAVSPDGRWVATAGSVGGGLEVFDSSGDTAWAVALGGRPVRVAWSPDGSLVAVALSADGAIALAGPSGVRVVEVGGTPDGLVFDDSGEILYAGDLFAGVVSVIDVEDAAVTRQFDIGESAGSMLVVGR